MNGFIRDEIRTAYKKESLRSHPDRLPQTATPQERRKATERFVRLNKIVLTCIGSALINLQQVLSDAYYVLSDPGRRAEYDSLFRSQPSSAFTEDNASEYEQAQASGNFFQNFAHFFQNATGSGADTKESTGTHAGTGTRPNADNIFGDVFEEMLAPEVPHVRPWWSWVGGTSGAALGYIVANVPGAVAGELDVEVDGFVGFAGNRLGAIRDAKGRAVGEVFKDLGGAQKAEILRALAFKVLGSMG
ncbi:hypothetical protein I307_02794 [Cryptococcus deuterogattii 99/473]|uniref:J domain-containing protein n=1 Tax=Cryptococcus deuterogattii Ram5 TaxID=1296110 RepID=A0A0D0V1B5_9TREE|nr:hypothetical protein I309_03194 [Cryptococcus deuterogattii LA55]KIR35441.1 hypothetical protein I352_01716 [Cryptococcus deuterogattii MMRL2647]KIR38710.1 hypothetical protein I313_05348 [Cryptococcus deuterogattii Ram5]KIR70895.1 hypothetical protein I310_05307 [Cryptococcus deuterogattii CA1014]KIR90505.1 hypothetical protein I304_05647 [Cryptococcus deuterogattii CBS 10090]KIR97237.1 hypothetical protein L804_05419 [Cryptococcus deuterogattii 2001/935-1]KIY57721.1 hypothetical protein 